MDQGDSSAALSQHAAGVTVVHDTQIRPAPSGGQVGDVGECLFPWIVSGGCQVRGLIPAVPCARTGFATVSREIRRLASYEVGLIQGQPPGPWRSIHILEASRPC